MKVAAHQFFRRIKFFIAVILAVTPIEAGAGTPPTQTMVRLPDGVELWRQIRETNNKPLFFALLEKAGDILFPDLPFDRSIAFLVGVSDYRYIGTNLPFVKNDLEDMRNYLLQQGGFDEVYVASNASVSSELIEDYMMNKFRSQLGKRDRLLFYYAGHGADAAGLTGYLQFSNARPGNFARDVLPVSRVLEWGRVNSAGHMLFILDTCSSGLAFSSRSGTDEEDKQKLISTLSGSGSRTVITAGTAGEQTFEVKTSESHGNGVFTRAFLGAVTAGHGNNNVPAFLTIDQIFADIKVDVAKFSVLNHKPLTPKLWTFDDDQYRGSFVFLNPAVRPGRIQPEHLTLLNAKRRGPEPTISSTPRVLDVKTYWGGDFIIRGRVNSLEGIPVIGALVRLKGGPHELEAITDANGSFVIDYNSIYTENTEYYFSVECPQCVKVLDKIALKDHGKRFSIGDDSSLADFHPCRVSLTVNDKNAGIYLNAQFLGVGNEVSSLTLDENTSNILTVLRPGRAAEEQKLTWRECEEGHNSIIIGSIDSSSSTQAVGSHPCRVSLKAYDKNASIYLDGKFIGTADQVSSLTLEENTSKHLAVVIPGHRATEKELTWRECEEGHNSFSVDPIEYVAENAKPAVDVSTCKVSVDQKHAILYLDGKYLGESFEFAKKGIPLDDNEDHVLNIALPGYQEGKVLISKKRCADGEIVWGMQKKK